MNTCFEIVKAYVKIFTFVEKRYFDFTVISTIFKNPHTSKTTNWNLKSARTWNLVFRLPRFIDLYIQMINLHDWEEKEGKNKKEKQESSLNETMNF